MTNAVSVNGTKYSWPKRPIVVICIDGSDQSYLPRCLGQASIPGIQNFIKQGFSSAVNGLISLFTCTSNMSIITGRPPPKHGISGNYYLDIETWRPVVKAGPELLRCDTVLAGFAHAGATVVSVNAEEKWRRQLGKGLTAGPGQISFSAEAARPCTLHEKPSAVATPVQKPSWQGSAPSTGLNQS